MGNLKRISVVALCAVMMVLCAGCVGSGANRQDLSVMIARVYPTVVSIEVDMGGGKKAAGSGVIINVAGSFSLIATNAHVLGKKWAEVPNSNCISVIHWSDELYSGKLDTDTTDMSPYTSKKLHKDDILYFSEKEDLAIIKYESAKYAVHFAKLPASLRTGNLRVGEPVAALGYSLGQYYRASVGVVTQTFPRITSKTTDFERGFMHDATAIQGNSGGPVFDAEGVVIGLTTAVAVSNVLEEKDSELNPSDAYSTLAFGFSIAISAYWINQVITGDGTFSAYIVQYSSWGM